MSLIFIGASCTAYATADFVNPGFEVATNGNYWVPWDFTGGSASVGNAYAGSCAGWGNANTKVGQSVDLTGVTAITCEACTRFGGSGTVTLYIDNVQVGSPASFMSGYHLCTFPISGYTGTHSVYLAFSNYFYVDEIHTVTTPTDFVNPGFEVPTNGNYWAPWDFTGGSASAGNAYAGSYAGWGNANTRVGQSVSLSGVSAITCEACTRFGGSGTVTLYIDNVQVGSPASFMSGYHLCTFPISGYSGTHSVYLAFSNYFYVDEIHTVTSDFVNPGFEVPTNGNYWAPWDFTGGSVWLDGRVCRFVCGLG